MNVKEYISSGILEAYVFSDLGDQEMREVQCMSHIYPEIKEEILKIEESFERFALEGKMDLPSSMKERVLTKVKETKQEGEAPKAPEKTDAKVISVKQKSEQETPVRRGGRSMLLVAASIALILICAYTSYQWTQGKNENERLQAKLTAQENEISSKSEELSKSLQMLSNTQETLSEKEERLAFLSGENTLKVPLNGLPGYEDHRVTMYYDKTSSETYCEVNNLKKLPSDQQYQLWAIVEGVPVSMAVFSVADMTTDWTKMQKMENVQTFAITIEPYGGKDSPTLENMVVAGNV